MADQSISVSSPVKIESDCKARVAFDLMEKIARYTSDENQRKDKKFWFTLYRQCHKAVNHTNLEGILKED
ncbi:MAG: hypothetical protein HIU83_11460 [Proteobacteria bacterium]|nr:hypothetical protein [Pseudomonadota bacterium]